MNYCFVTAFYDIGRSGWAHFRRTSEDYLRYFSVLCEMHIPLIIFIDCRYRSQVDDIISTKRPPALFTQVISVNEDFLKLNIHSWRWIERQRSIMHSDKYRNLMTHRSNCPEANYPEYNCINFAKIDFVILASQQFPMFDYLGWVDFGFMQEGTTTPDRKFNPQFYMNFDSIVQLAWEPPMTKDSDPVKVMTSGRNPIIGPFWFGPTTKMFEFQSRLHLALEELHDLGVADDDQTLYVYTYFHHNADQLIKLHILPPDSGWFVGFQLGDPERSSQ